MDEVFDPNSDEAQEALRRFHNDGLMWLINTSLLHPRGMALFIQIDEGRLCLGVRDFKERMCFDIETMLEGAAKHARAESRAEAGDVGRT